MTYDVYVSGRRNPMRFSNYTTADAYRRVIVTTAGRFAWIQVQR